MEQLLFYRYRKFKLEQYTTPRDKLKRIPCHIRRLFFTALVCMVVCILSLFLCSNSWSHIITVLAELMCALAFSVAAENFYIQNSQEQMERYWEYCSKLKDILDDVNVHTQKDIEEIKERVEKRIYDMKNEQQVKNAFWIKLGEIIAVPVILSIITASIGKVDRIGEMVVSVISILLVSGAVLATLLILFNLLRFQKKRKMEQMIEFRDDLQGVLDLERFGTDVHNRNSDEK